MIYAMLLALLIAIGYGLYLSIIQVEGLEHTGESSQRILSTIELANRATFYIDTAIDEAVKKAIRELEQDAGFLIEEFEHIKTDLPCGKVVFPLLNKQQQVECFPEYEETLERNIQRELIINLHQFNELDLSKETFTTTLERQEGDIQITVRSSPIQIPIYSTLRSYYDPTIKDRMQRSRPIENYRLNPETGYYERGGLVSVPRSNPNHPDSIVLHYTAGGNVEGAYETLRLDGNSYHYIIDYEGTIFNFADEERVTYHAGCSRTTSPTCIPYNQRSIGVSFVNRGHAATTNCEVIPNLVGYPGFQNKCWEIYPEEQIEAGVQLVADIIERQAKRGRIIKPTREFIKTHHEIDRDRKQDPGPMFDEEEFVQRVRQELDRRQFPYEI